MIKVQTRLKTVLIVGEVTNLLAIITEINANEYIKRQKNILLVNRSQFK